MTYVDILESEYPNVHFCYRSLSPNDYSSIVWLNNTIIPKEELDDKLIKLHKSKKIEELSNQARSKIESGFISNALGYDRFYDGKIEDQLNIAGATVAADQSGYFLFPCRDPETLEKSYISHSHEQMIKVSSDGALFKLNILKYFNDIKTHILNSNLTISEIDSIQMELD